MRTATKRKRLPERFRDLDRTNQMHDQIVMWTHKNAKRIAIDLWLEYGPSDVAEVRFKVWSEWEKLLKDNKYVVGFVDLVIHCEIEGRGSSNWPYHGQWNLGIEAKTHITSCGELIRQLRLYESKMGLGARLGRMVVVSPDDQYAGLLRQQGFGFIKYPDADSQEQAEGTTAQSGENARRHM